MSNLQKTKVSVAANPIHNFPKNYNHVTTSAFMQFNLATVMETPKSSIKCKHKTFLRTMPLKRPLLSNINIHKQAYFVPYRTIWEPWSDFRTDTPHNQPSGTGIISNNPLMDMFDLIQVFKDPQFSISSTIVPSDLEHGCDFQAYANGGNSYHTFTKYGRWAWKLFNSMGLRIPFPLDNTIKQGDFTVSCLPFLAVAKVYLDYFYPNQYAHYGVYASLDGILQRHVTYTLTQDEIKLILSSIYKVSYGDDYFVSAFDKPLVGASGVQSVDFEITDVSLSQSSSTPVNQSKVVQDSVNATPIIKGNNSYSYLKNVSQYINSSLKALENYIRRHALAGSRALTRYLADWGVTLTADKLRRCYKLSECVFPLQVGDVMSTADTITREGDTGATLGDYAGRAVAFNGDFDFECDTDEDGLLVVTYSVVPSVSYVQGIQRYWFHKTKLDYLTGDFDGLSIREINQLELFCGTKRAVSLSSIFGFIPSYAELKVDYDVQSGDFACDTKNLGLMGFESARKFSDAIGDSSFDEVHGLDFVLGNDSTQYNRIFFEDADEADKFILIHRAEFEHRLPAVPLYDNYDFEDGKKQILLEVNGSKDN